jgi:hypothetical protein
LGERVSGLGLCFEPVVVDADKMGKDLGVGGGFERMALGEQLALQSVEVFDDAIMDQDDAPGLVRMRMGIFVGRRAVGGPAGMANTELTVERLGSAKTQMPALS